MADRGKGKKQAAPPAGKDPAGRAPDWAEGLKQLYDAVVDEPLPDAIKDLLAKLDEEGPGDKQP